MVGCVGKGRIMKCCDSGKDSTPNAERAMRQNVQKASKGME